MLERRAATAEMDFSGDALRSLVAMTPLSWHADPERVRALLQRDALRVTADFVLLAGRTRG